MSNILHDARRKLAKRRRGKKKAGTAQLKSARKSVPISLFSTSLPLMRCGTQKLFSTLASKDGKSFARNPRATCAKFEEVSRGVGSESFGCAHETRRCRYSRNWYSYAIEYYTFNSSVLHPNYSFMVRKL